MLVGNGTYPRGCSASDWILDMVRTVVLGISSALLALAVFLLWLILQEQREQSRELSKLTNCVYVLQDSIGATPGEPVRRCPIE